MLMAANRVLRDPAAAEDVVQDVFMSLWRKPSSFDASRGTLPSYLTMMARSRALDRWRTRSVRQDAVERTAHERMTDPATAEDAAERVIRRDNGRNLLGALDRLPGDQREAVLLAFGKGLTAREIAQASGVPVGTAKSRVRLGLQRARSELASVA
jgi:RNA polymerase sigma-70 factor (ECF subfamily)